MEIISLNTSLFFFMRKMNGAIKSLCDRKAGLPKVRPGSGRPDSPGLSGRPARSVLLIYS